MVLSVLYGLARALVFLSASCFLDFYLARLFPHNRFLFFCSLHLPCLLENKLQL